MKSLIIFALLGVISSAYGGEVTCRDDSWVKVEKREEGPLCFKTFIFQKQTNYEDARKECTSINGYPAPMVDENDEIAILASFKKVSYRLVGSFDKPSEIFLGAKRNFSPSDLLFEWELGNKTIIYNDTRWYKAEKGESGNQPNYHTGGKNEGCIAFHPRDSKNRIKFHDTLCECDSPTSPGCNTHKRNGITCATMPSIMVENDWKKKKCEDGEYCDEILNKLQDWFRFVRANSGLSNQKIAMLHGLYNRDATYTFEVTKNGNLTVNQQDKPISILFFDHFVKELQNNAQTIEVTPSKVTQYVEENYFDAIFSFKGGEEFAAQLGTIFNENLEIVKQTFKVTKGKAPKVVAPSTAATA